LLAASSAVHDEEVAVTSQAQIDQEAQERVETLKKELDKQVGRWVTALVALLAPVIAIACAWLQDKVGIDLNPEEVTGVISATVLGVTGMGATWLYNRGNFERNAERVYAIYLRGEEARRDLDRPSP
jgi:hypothetical protein